MRNAPGKSNRDERDQELIEDELNEWNEHYQYYM